MRTFEDFCQQVKDSCEKHAQRKGYTTSAIDGENQLLKVCVALGIHDDHAIGEILYKLIEYRNAPEAVKPVLLEKVAGWAWTMWRELPK